MRHFLRFDTTKRSKVTFFQKKPLVNIKKNYISVNSIFTIYKVCIIRNSAMFCLKIPKPTSELHRQTSGCDGWLMTGAVMIQERPLKYPQGLPDATTIKKKTFS